MEGSVEKCLSLYHFPTSFYSMKARIALAEKGIPYKSIIVNLLNMEIYQPWYMKINPEGKVPALDTGSEVIADSNAIIRYLDKAYPNTVQMFPTDNSPRSQKVLEFQRRLDDIKIGVLSYGSAIHEDLVEGSKLPGLARRRMRKVIQSGGKQEIIRALAKKHPELKEAYELKLTASDELDANMMDRKIVVSELDKVETIFDDIEKHLARNEGGENYIGGTKFTIADIILAITLERMIYVGLSRRFWELGQRPHLANFYKDVQSRPSFIDECKTPTANIPKYFLASVLQEKVLPVAVKASIAFGVAFVVWWYRDKIKALWSQFIEAL